MSASKAKAHGNRAAGSFGKSQEDREVDSNGEQELERESPTQFGDDDREAEEVYGDGDGDAYDEDDDEKRGGGAGGSKVPRERRKIEIKFIQNKARRHITFSKRKHGIMKKAWELSVLTGTQILLLVVSETGLVYTFTTPKLQPLVTQSEGKNLIQACLNAPDTPLDMEDGSVKQDAAEGSGSTPPPTGPTPDPSIAAHHAQVQAAAQAQAQAAQAQAAHTQAQVQAAEVQAAQAAQANAVRQSGTQSPNEANQAAVEAARALQSAQATQAMAVSGLPPHLQQLAGSGYKVVPPQYGGFQNFSPLPTGMGGQLNSQLANQLQGQMSGQQLGHLDTATLLALKQQQEGIISQSDYAHLFQQQQQHSQAPQHAGPSHVDAQQPPPPQQPPQPQSQRFN